MIGFDEALRLARLQERLRASTYHELSKDGLHKSDEGSINLTVTLPPVVGDQREPYWTVDVYSYLLCPSGRSKAWRGRTAAEAISKAEDAVADWCVMSEMEMFEAAIGGPPNDGEANQTGVDESEMPF